MSLFEKIRTSPGLKVIHSICRDIKMLGMMTESDRHYIVRKYNRMMHTKPNLKTPLLFQEKLQWLKLHDRKPIYHTMVDKMDAKSYIKEILGEDYCIPTLGVYNKFEDINFDQLPDKFVLKCTFDSGSYCICTDKKVLDKKKVKERLLVNWKYDYYYYSREWPYKGLKHRIIAEPFLYDGTGDYLRDYKFYTFNGEPKFFYTTSNRGGEGGLKEDFFDIEGRLLEFNQVGFYNNPNTPAVPKCLQKMIDIARKLAKDTYHLRVDFYEVGDKIYVGELTFFDGGGFCGFEPEKYNQILGEWIKLPIDEDK